MCFPCFFLLDPQLFQVSPISCSFLQRRKLRLRLGDMETGVEPRQPGVATLLLVALFWFLKPEGKVHRDLGQATCKGPHLPLEQGRVLWWVGQNGLGQKPPNFVVLPAGLPSLLESRSLHRRAWPLVVQRVAGSTFPVERGL